MGLDLSGEQRAIDSQKHIFDKVNFKSLHLILSTQFITLTVFPWEPTGYQGKNTG